MSQLWASIHDLRVGSVRKGENMREFTFKFKIQDDGGFSFTYRADDPDAINSIEILGALEAAKMDVVKRCFETDERRT